MLRSDPAPDDNSAQTGRLSHFYRLLWRQSKQAQLLLIGLSLAIAMLSSVPLYFQQTLINGLAYGSISLHQVLALDQAYAWDRDARRADRLADELALDLGIEFKAVADLAEATRASDVIVTCTPSHEALLTPNHVRPGTFIAAVGADHPEKQEIHPRLMAASTVVVDDLEQCATSGDLHHALESGDMTRDQVHSELAEVVAGKKPGRTRDAEITIFDSTGIALEDAAAAVLVYEGLRIHGSSVE